MYIGALFWSIVHTMLAPYSHTDSWPTCGPSVDPMKFRDTMFNSTWFDLKSLNDLCTNNTYWCWLKRLSTQTLYMYVGWMGHVIRQVSWGTRTLATTKFFHVTLFGVVVKGGGATNPAKGSWCVDHVLNMATLWRHVIMLLTMLMICSL